jgi:hypothetical protein
MQNMRLSIPPIALSATLSTTLLEPGTSPESGETGYTPSKSYILFRHMRVVNTTNAALLVSLFKGAAGADAAGTEFAWNAASVPANGYLDWVGECRLDGTATASALTGGASNTGLTLNIDCAEIGFA